MGKPRFGGAEGSEGTEVGFGIGSDEPVSVGIDAVGSGSVGVSSLACRAGLVDGSANEGAAWVVRAVGSVETSSVGAEDDKAAAGIDNCAGEESSRGATGWPQC